MYFLQEEVTDLIMMESDRHWEIALLDEIPEEWLDYGGEG